MHTDIQIITINESNVDQHGFFCYMSKPKSIGYRQKREWLESRFAEGMVIKIVHEERGRDVGFIEYHTALEVQEFSPSAYGVFGILLDGRLLSYHYLEPKGFDKLLANL